MISNLDNAIELHAGAQHWTYVKDYLPVFQTHGWCSGAATENATLPEWGAMSWASWDPSTWDPYQPMGRYFRTPNDAALTEMQSTPRPAPPPRVNHRQAETARIAERFLRFFPSNVSSTRGHGSSCRRPTRAGATATVTVERFPLAGSRLGRKRRFNRPGPAAAAGAHQRLNCGWQPRRMRGGDL
jgi:hypothetical protein